jgi:hypothetical protein
MSSKSPKSRRGSAQSHEQFSKRKVAQGVNTSPEPENSGPREIAGTRPRPPLGSADTLTVWASSGGIAPT